MHNEHTAGARSSYANRDVYMRGGSSFAVVMRRTLHCMYIRENASECRSPETSAHHVCASLPRPRRLACVSMVGLMLVACNPFRTRTWNIGQWISAPSKRAAGNAACCLRDTRFRISQLMDCAPACLLLSPSLMACFPRTPPAAKTIFHFSSFSENAAAARMPVLARICSARAAWLYIPH